MPFREKEVLPYSFPYAYDAIYQFSIVFEYRKYHVTVRCFDIRTSERTKTLLVQHGENAGLNFNLSEIFNNIINLFSLIIQARSTPAPGLNRFSPCRKCGTVCVKRGC